MTSIHAIINRQLLKWELQQQQVDRPSAGRTKPPPIITVSRQKGSRGSYFASRLAEKMDYQLLHRDVIDTICETAGYRKRVVESLDNRFRGELELLVESVFTGQMIDHHDYLKHLCRIVLSMSELGGVVLMGRGGNFILGPRRGFHIRYVAPTERRIANLVTYGHMSESEATDAVGKADAERKEFIRKLFGADIDAPQHYDLVINADYLDVEELTDAVRAAIEAKFDKLTYMDRERC
ncbi:MAG: cytidylate kinase-like family protein [Candidatus Zixiibacteriota bacterium]|nr:MAG: cytidylate kinase-like family protein [candidate division Zixibacteria bacterium]